jgi:hypothetical protein
VNPFAVGGIDPSSNYGKEETGYYFNGTIVSPEMYATLTGKPPGPPGGVVPDYNPYAPVVKPDYNPYYDPRLAGRDDGAWAPPPPVVNPYDTQPKPYDPYDPYGTRPYTPNDVYKQLPYDPTYDSSQPYDRYSATTPRVTPGDDMRGINLNPNYNPYAIDNPDFQLPPSYGDLLTRYAAHPAGFNQPISSYDDLLGRYMADNRKYDTQPDNPQPDGPRIAWDPQPQPLPSLPLPVVDYNPNYNPYDVPVMPSGYSPPSGYPPLRAEAINPQMLAHGISGLVSALSGMTGNRTPSGGSTPGYGQQLPPRLVRMP